MGRRRAKEDLGLGVLDRLRLARRLDALRHRARVHLHAPALKVSHHERRLLLNISARAEGQPCVVRVLPAYAPGLGPPWPRRTLGFAGGVAAAERFLEAAEAAGIAASNDAA